MTYKGNITRNQPHILQGSPENDYTRSQEPTASKVSYTQVRWHDEFLTCWLERCHHIQQHQR